MAEPRLKGTTVIVTRPEHQAEPLCRAVERGGGQAVRFPAVAILPPRAPAVARRGLARLRPGDWAVFISPNAVHHGLKYMPGGALPGGVRSAAVGPATADALRAAGVSGVIVPRRHDSEGLLTHRALQDLSGRRVALLKAPGGRRVLARGLRQRGAEVTSVLVYRRERPAVDSEALAAWLPAKGRVVTTVTSGEVLDNLVHMVNADTLERLQRTPLVAAGERVAGLARWAGFRQVRVAAGPDAGSLVRAITREVT